MQTTLNKIRRYVAEPSLLEKLLKSFGKSEPDDDPVSIVRILDSSGLWDSLKCLRTVEGFDKEKRLFSIFCAKQVAHLLLDDRSKRAIAISERFANGEATVEELKSASLAAEIVVRYPEYCGSRFNDYAAAAALYSSIKNAYMQAAEYSAAAGVAGVGLVGSALLQAAQEQELRRICAGI